MIIESPAGVVGPGGLRDYGWPYIRRVLTRTQLLYAMTRGVSEEDNSTRIALGLHMTLADARDPVFAAAREEARRHFGVDNRFLRTLLD